MWGLMRNSGAHGDRVRHAEPGRRRRGIAAAVAIGALLASGVVALQVVPAAAASHTFLVNSLSHQGDDAAPGDGVCETATGLCTLRAALQESNALPADDTVTIAPADDVDSATPGVQPSGTIVASGTGATNMMYVGTLTPWGDSGAYFMATATVTFDFQNRLGIASLNDAGGATAIYLNGPDVAVRNFSNIKSNETAFVFGPSGDGAVVENGSCTDPGSINLERCFWLADGADGVTIRNVEMGSTYSGGGSAIRVAAGATINDLTLDRIRMFDPDTEAYYGFQMQGSATLNGLTITGSTFEGFQSGRYQLDLTGATLTDATITGNTFTRINSAGATSIYVNRAGSGNVIERNTLSNTAAQNASYGVYFAGMGLTGTASSGWTVQDNYFDGRRSWSVFVGAGSGILPVQRNTFGPNSFGGGTPANEDDTTALVFNEGVNSNQNIRTWFPTAVAPGDQTCTLDVTVTPPTAGVVPATPVTIDVYYTPTTKAEVYLGSQSGITAATTITVPYTLGAGNIRVQTTAATGATSQYSRVLAQPEADSCGPFTTVEQAASQADPTSVRDIHFTVTLSETVTADLLPAAVSTEGSTAPGARVTSVTRTSGSSFDVVARADGSGLVQLSLPEGAIADDAANPSQASTSTDNVVQYVSPLTLAPTELSVEEGGATGTYTVTSSLPATAPLTIAPTVTDPAWATLTPSPLVVPTTASSGEIVAAAVDDSIVNGTRTTTITHQVTSTDPNFDGLVLPDVALEVLDNDQPVPTDSSLTISSGTRVANGVESHAATATVRNAAGGPVGGQLVTFQTPSAVTASAGSCVTASDGTCSVTLTTTVAADHEIRAFLEAGEIGGSPATASFVAGPWDPATTTITSSHAELVADGVGSAVITITLVDAFGNRITSSGGPALWNTTGGGTLSEQADNGDGTYTARLTAPTTVGAARVSANIGGQTTQWVQVNFIPGEASPGQSTIEADPTSITADGVSTSTVTVTLVDAYGNPVTAGGDTVELATTAGSLSDVADNGDGTYTATLTSATTAGPATVTYVLDGAAGSTTAVVEFVPGAADPATSDIEPYPSSLTADGVSQSSVIVTLRDADGNPLATGGDVVEMTTDVGSIGAVRDNGDGTYTAVFTSPRSPGVATISYTVNGVTGTATATITLLAGAPDADSSLIAADPTSVVANETDTSTITVTVRDAQGTVLTEGGAAVEILTDLGTLGPVTDNLDGTYTATLTAGTTTGPATVTFTVNGATSASTATVLHTPGPADAGASTIAAAPTSVTADGTATSRVTVTLQDAYGNPLEAGGDTVTVATDLGGLGSVLDNGDGTYTAFLTSALAGTATLTYTVNGAAGAGTATVDFVAGAADPATSTIAADPESITADGVSTSTITVTLLDAGGNPLTAGGDTVTIETTNGTMSDVTDNGDGTYTATLTSTPAVGTATVSFTVNGADAAATTDVELVAGPPAAGPSVIEADPAMVVADGESAAIATVTLYDANGNPVTSGGADVVIATTLGTVGEVIDNGDGTYTASITSTTTGEAVLSFTVAGDEGGNSTAVEFVAGAADPGTSTIAADPESLTADGASTSTITVQLVDANGNPLSSSGGTVTMTTTAGELSAVTDNGDGTYTATLTSSTDVETATVSFTVAGADATATAAVAFVAGPADPASSTITADPAQIEADGSSTSTVTVTLLDANGNPVGASGGTVAMATDAGTLGAVVDNGDGTYTATLTAPTSTDPPAATITFALDGVDGTATATVAFVAGVPSTTTSTIEADPIEIIADGSSTSTVTVTLLDGNGNPVTDAGDVVTIATDAGTLGAVADNGDGTYTATLTSSTSAETATVEFAIDGAGASATATVDFVAGPADPATSTIEASPTQITADGASTSAITVTLLDANGNPVGASGGTVTLATTAGALSDVTDNGDGTWTATLTSSTAVETATVSFMVSGADADATATVEFVAGAADPEASTIVADPASITADGVSTSTVTVTLLDANGNPVTDAGDVVALATTAGSLGAVTDNGDGTYTATLTSSTTAETATVSFTVDGAAGAATAEVEFVAGAADPGTSTIVADPASITADGVSTSTVTVTLLDANGNPVTDAGDVVALATTAGSLGAVTDNGDGTYTATLTSGVELDTATISFTVDGAAGTATAEVEFVAGAADPGTSTIVADPTSITADGVSTSTVTVTLLDANGNPVTDAGDVVALATTAGSLGAVTDNGDGTYTATLTSSTTAGTATVTFSVDGAPATNSSATVEFVAGAADPGLSTIVADPTSITADGVSTSTVTVTLLDANGNPLTASGGEVAMAATAGSLGSVTDNGDGTYTATLTSATAAGTATLTFTLDGVDGTDTADVEFTAGAADPTTSMIEADPTSIVADGASTSTVTVTLLDANGNPVGASGGDVVVSTDAGTVGATTDNGDGTYTATLTSSTTAGTATLTFTLDGAGGTDTATVELTAGAADPGTSTIEADPTSIVADGASTSTVTVTLLDANGNPVGASGGDVVVSTDAGTVGATTDNGDGTYTATLTSSTTAGTATLTFTLEGTSGTDTATVELTAGPPDPGLSTIAADPTSITADGTSTSTITVTLLDANGNPVPSGGNAVVVATNLGTVGAVTDNGDGTYTATLTSATAAGTATVSFTLDGTAGTDTAEVVFVAGAPDPATSTIAADPTSITADGVATSTVTVTAVDANGNPVGAGGAAVVIAASAGTISGVTDNGDGTYTAVLTSATAAGTATLTFTLDGTAGTDTAEVAFVAGAADPATSQIAADPTSIVADGVSTSTVTVTLLDANGNPLTSGGDAVTIATDVGTIGAVTDNGDGTYTATLTSATSAGMATLTFTVGGAAADATASVAFVAGPADPGTSTIAADPTSITADGASTSTVTVTLLDANGNPVGAGGAVVVVSTDTGAVSGVTDNGDGTYTATLTSATQAGTATLSFTVDGVDADATATVEFVAGAADPGTSTIEADPTSITADGTSTSTVTVTLLDASGNPVGASAGTVVVATDAGTVSAVTDNGDGTYTATLTAATTAGTATLTFTLDGVDGTDTAAVDFVAGAPDPGASTIEADPTSITADGAATSTVTVTVRDAQGNPVPGGGNAVVVTTNLGSVGTTTDNGDGTYTAILTSGTAAGTATLTFTLDGVDGADTAAVDFVAGAADPGTSTIEADPTSIVADGASTSTVTVTLLDANGNPVGASAGTVVVATDAGTVSGVTDNGDGTYTAILTSETAAGTATLTFTLDDVDGADTAAVAFVAGAADPGTSTIEADPTSIVADGASTSTVTVTLLDANGNPVGAGGDAVTLSSTAGTLSGVTDNGDGTYTATLTSATAAGTATVSFTVNDAEADATAAVQFVAGAADPGTSTIEADPTSIVADGASTSTVTVTLLDANGNPVTAGGDDVVVSTDAGTVSAVTDNGDGTYSATLTSATTAGTATLTFTVNDAAADATATVQFVAGAADPGTSTIEADPTSITADGASTSTITVTLQDSNGNPVGTGGDTVTIATDAGTLGVVTDNGDGTYTATFTSATTAGTATVSFTVNGADAPATAEVQLTAGAADPATSTIEAAPTTIVADGTSTSAVTVTLLDANGNPVGASGGAVVVATDAGTISGTVDNGDGTYTATLTSATAVGTATLTFTLDGAAGADTASVEFTADAADPATSTIAADPTSIPADGASTSTITVTLLDANGNPVGAGGDAVTLSSTAGTLSGVTDNGDGTYTATLTSATAAGTATVSFTVNGAGADATAEVTFTAGAADPATSTIAADPASIVADGVSTSTITVTLRDVNGNPVTDAGDVVALATTLGTLGAVTAGGDGTYTALLTSGTAAGTATVSFTIDGVAGESTAAVTFTAGAADPGSSTIAADPASIVADGVSTSTVTVQLVDSNGNPLTDSGGTVVIGTDAGVLTATTDNGDGTYTATLTSSTDAGTATLTFTVNGAASSSTASVAFTAGAPDPATSTITADPTQITADGVSTSTVTLTLLDANGNPVGASGGTVTMSTDAGALGPVSDNGDGTYTAVLTSPTSTDPPAAIITFALNGTPGTATATVAFVAGVPSTTTSEIAADPASITADGVSTSTVTVTLRDGNGNPVTDAGDVVTLTTTLGVLGGVTNNGDGTYTATLTSATTVGTATVSFAIGGAGASATAEVDFVPGPADPGTSKIVASPTQIVADGVSTSAVTVTLLDANGNPVGAGGSTVTMATSAGTLGTVTDNGDGTYTATLTSATSVGTATVSFAVGGAAGAATASVEFVVGVPDPSTSTIAAAPATIESDGTTSSTVTVTLVDANGNPVPGGGDDVTITTSLGTLSAVADNGDGTYTATLTATQIGTAVLTFTVNGANGTTTAQVAVVDTTPPAPPVITAPSDGASVRPDVLVEGTGEPGATVTVTDGGGTVVCTAAVDATGAWSCTPSSPLPVGETTLVAAQTDPSDNTSEPSAPVTVTVDDTAPAPPQLDPTNGAEVTGVSEPGTTVTIRDSGGNVVCVTTADAGGRFVCVPAERIPTGTLLSATATDEAGNTSEPGFVRVGGASVTLELSVAEAGDVQIAYGRGFLPGESVSGLLESDPVDLGTLTADENGAVTFTVTLPADIDPGTHRVTLTGDASGEVWAEFEVPAQVPPPGPGPAPGPGPGWPGLPGTGIGVLPSVGAVLLLLGLGAGLLGVSRRRRGA
ncbi:Ig domain protein group 1 domain protein [Beutenbergia cavernae DSM 12333]|uniref:Ig domain protein group 1 domain protein n=1 Tax=Beutenbergia cavernae (strain ATCC BAA-8 / DSM 12333 / CCUG 43141 / JCM 11478 / NBRC 16432 / NCIMB 13614 / HKI 0122) TaxID=471853 RepID=C5BYC7_BEUC1|nr:invasin domain 3-containing protein [Beutenbergia cavernae]ACQ81027.1 Ig domain protein group 1 domain protein [Beutenbergia cavernae DSM 12333]